MSDRLVSDVTDKLWWDLILHTVKDGQALNEIVYFVVRSYSPHR